MRTLIHRGTRASGSARALAREMGVKCNSLVRTRFRPRDGDVIINWGCSQSHLPDGPAVWLNPPEAVQVAANKLLALQSLTEAGVPTLEFTTNRDEALRWAQESDVVGRQMLRASSGRGIVWIPQGVDNVPPCPLYTRYFKGFDEYRVHVIGPDVFDVQQKRRRRDFDEERIDLLIRSYERGWVFCREEMYCPESVLDAACAAVEALELDFGAVDVKYNRHYGRCAVLEVNTAPGLQGATLGVYADGLSRLVEENQ